MTPAQRIAILARVFAFYAATLVVGATALMLAARVAARVFVYAWWGE